jgi:21S rRNA (uridine2791-2'-O)-methyltransferase
VIGIDILPVQPPKGVSTIQGNFLSPAVQAEVRSYVQDASRGRVKSRLLSSSTPEELPETGRSYVDIERHAQLETSGTPGDEGGSGLIKAKKLSLQDRDEAQGRVVDVVLSDMSAPWDQTTGEWIKSISNPYRRMMNTSGIGFKDHVGSMVCVPRLKTITRLG